MTDEQRRFLDSLEEPVTVAAFSNHFNIGLTESESCLVDYVDAHDDIWALFEICGTRKIENSSFLPKSTSLEVTHHSVVPQCDVEKRCQKFVKVFTKKLYSIQRTKQERTRVFGTEWNNNDDAPVIRQEVRTIREETKDPTSQPEVATTSSTATRPAEKKSKIQKTTTKMDSFFTAAPKQKKTNDEKVETVAPEKKETKKPEPAKEKTPIIVEAKAGEQKTPTKKRKRPSFEDDDLFDADDDIPMRSPAKSPSPPKETQQKKRKTSDIEGKKENKSEKNKKKNKVIVESSDDEPEEKVVQTKKKTVISDVSESSKNKTKTEKVVETFVDEDGFLVSRQVNKVVEVKEEKSPMKLPMLSPPKLIKRGPKKNASITSFFKKS